MCSVVSIETSVQASVQTSVQYRERGGRGEAGRQCGDVGRRGRRGRDSIMGRCLVQFSELEMVLGCK